MTAKGIETFGTAARLENLIGGGAVPFTRVCREILKADKHQRGFRHSTWQIWKDQPCDLQSRRRSL